MKKLTAFIVIISMFYSCKTFDNAVKQTYTTIDPVGYDTTHLTYENKPTPIYDTMVVLAPTWKQALKESHEGFLFWGGVGGAVVSIPWAATLYNPTTMFPVTVTCLVVSSGSLEWYKWNSDRVMTKKKYDSLVAKYGLKQISFWNLASN